MSQWTLNKDKTPAIIVLTILAIIGYLMVYPKMQDEKSGQLQYETGVKRLADGHYEEAIKEFNASIERDAGNVHSHFQIAITMMQLKRNNEAFTWFERTLKLDDKYAAAYANRGILYDRMGDYELALEDYKQSLILDGEIVEGPGALTRFLKNIKDKPTTVYDRAVYIQEQLKLPPDKRDLRRPEEDAKQMMYKKKQKQE